MRRDEIKELIDKEKEVEIVLHNGRTYTGRFISINEKGNGTAHFNDQYDNDVWIKPMNVSEVIIKSNSGRR